MDDYWDEADADGLAAVDDLPPTLTTKTPHTDGEGGGHRFYAIDPGEEFGTAEEACETVGGTANPAPSWGEVQVHNQYVVGPGSVLNGCDKDGCDECAEPDGGRYRIAADRPIATITTDTLADVIRTDPQYQSAGGNGATGGTGDSTTEGSVVSVEYGPADGPSAEAVVNAEP